jgi:hypothetical protein
MDSMKGLEPNFKDLPVGKNGEWKDRLFDVPEMATETAEDTKRRIEKDAAVRQSGGKGKKVRALPADLAQREAEQAAAARAVLEHPDVAQGPDARRQEALHKKQYIEGLNNGLKNLADEAARDFWGIDLAAGHGTAKGLFTKARAMKNPDIERLVQLYEDNSQKLRLKVQDYEAFLRLHRIKPEEK